VSQVFFLMNLVGIKCALVLSLITPTISRAQSAPGTGPPQTPPSQTANEQPQRATATPGDDLPLGSIPSHSVSVRFVIAHRSRLNGHTIRVRGIITSALVGDAACPPDRGMCAPNSILLADSDASRRRSDSSIRVLLPQDARAQDFAVGKRLEIKVAVHGNNAGVALTMQK